MAGSERAQLPEPGAQSLYSRPTVQVGTRSGGRGGGLSEAQPSGAPCWLRAHREQQREACSCCRKMERAGALGKEHFYHSGAQLRLRQGKKAAGGIWERSPFASPKPDLCIMLGTPGPGEEEAPSWCQPCVPLLPALSFSAVSRVSAWGKKETPGDSPHALLLTLLTNPKTKAEGSLSVARKVWGRRDSLSGPAAPPPGNVQDCYYSRAKRRKGNLTNGLFSPFLRGSGEPVEVSQPLLVSKAGAGQWEPGWLPLLGSRWLPGTESAPCQTLHSC